MSVNSTDAFSGPYTATGAAQVFPFTFIAASRDEVQVTANGVVVDPTSYSVTINGDGTGAVNAVVSPGAEVFVESNPDFEQAAQFSRFAPYFPDAINVHLDRAAIRDIALRDRIARTFVVPRDFRYAVGKFPTIDDNGDWTLADGVPGIPGPAGSTFTSLAALKAAPISNKTYILATQSGADAGVADGPFKYRTGDFTGRADVVALDAVPISTGALVRTGAAVDVTPAALASGAFDIMARQTIAGQSVAPARGNVHAFDVATIGTAEFVSNKSYTGTPPTGWTISTFTAANPGISKTAGAQGSARIPVTVTPWTTYLVTLSATTTAKGGLAIYLDGNPASNINEFPMHPTGALTRSFYLFSYSSSGVVNLEIQGEARWAGTVTNISMRQVLVETPFDFVSVSADRKDFSNPMGVKFGRFLAGNIHIGDRTAGAMQSQNAAWNIGIGNRTNASTIDGFENTAVGAFTLEFNQTSRATAFGYSALRSNATGEQNTGIGYKAFVSNITGGNNTGVGFHCFLYNRDGSNNVGVGTLAGYYNESGNYITAIGSQAGINAGGDAGVYIGALSGPLRAGEFRFTYNDQTCVGTEASGYGNGTTSIGRLAQCGVDPTQPGGYEITTEAVAVGRFARAQQDSSVAVGGNSTAAMVRSTAVGQAAASGHTNSASFGYAATSSAPNQVTLGNTAIAETRTAGYLRANFDDGVPVGGDPGIGLKATSVQNLGVFFGSGTPTMAAAKGSLYMRTDGSSTSTRMYVNTDGASAWTNVTTAA